MTAIRDDMRRALACLLLITFGVVPIAEAATPSAGYELQRALEYGRHDGQVLTGDLYVPEASGRYPVLVAVHGGDWKFADSSLYQHWGPYLAQHGYALFAINYRLLKD